MIAGFFDKVETALYIVKFKEVLDSKINTFLKYSEIKVNSKGRLAEIGMYLGDEQGRIHTANEDFNRLSKREKGRYVKNFMEDRKYGLGEVYGRSEGGRMYVYITIEKMDLWADFAEAVTELDMNLQGMGGL